MIIAEKRPEETHLRGVSSLRLLFGRHDREVQLSSKERPSTSPDLGDETGAAIGGGPYPGDTLAIELQVLLFKDFVEEAAVIAGKHQIGWFRQF